MKRIIWTILLAIPCSIYAQKTTLVVGGTLADCPEFVRENTHMIQGIRVFEIPSNRLIYEATSTSSSFIPRHLEIENVKVGGYRISYSLNPDYSPYQDKYITLKAIPTNYVNFCRYDKSVEPINIFNGASIGDTIIIENNTAGCFDHHYSKTFLIQTASGWTIQQHQYRVDCGLESKTGKLEVSQKPTRISKAKFIKKEDIAKINLAINKIRMLTSGGCTTKSIYTIKYQKKTLSLYDGSCENHLNDILYSYTASYY
jgi:hypothetical protein